MQLRISALLHAAAWTCASLATTLSAHAAGYPEKPVQIIVPFPPGGAGDVMGRLLSRQLEARLGQPVIVDNKPGAGTAIGAQFVANAKPDGYTLLLSSNSTYTLNPAIQPKLSYDPIKAFEPLGMVANLALVLVAHPTVQASSVQQLVAAAKAEPDKYMYGSFGNGTVSHFAGEMFKSAAGVKLTHVPYRGSAPAMTDLVGGQIPLAFDSVVAAVPHIKTGKIKPLAVTTAARSTLLPDVPTVAESGYPGYQMSSWIVLVAPRGLPPEVKQKLEQALAASMEDAEMREKLKGVGFEPAYAPIKDWSGMVGKDIARLRKIAEQSQIKPD
ncbi:Tripartite-type tricarboxylate transporter, receptor component TctC [Variovorax sp. CF079]|uniref:Bug family tripartite tricarboxylate transporter substrate binding protein n=1 Tax=Variovorax sp. CF079 TaxID=1882774 RepID=UPI000883D876|nr:tripartite tricarboxylate transporter substrate binding protein [Variovorax sp. CF079]SDE08187.1 Tripartite-type tricarboxylate transporter, receptor component TctC [Variovorax sp. CF079]